MRALSRSWCSAPEMLRTAVVLSLLIVLYGCSTLSSNEIDGGSALMKNTSHQIREGSCVGNSVDDVMVRVGPLCIDKYEASVWSEKNATGTLYGVFAGQSVYPAGFPDNGNWSVPVYAVSKAGVLPSTGLTWFMAQQACALSGKRLLTNAEWQMAAAGTPDLGVDDKISDCVIGTYEVAKTGSRKSCSSAWGVNDMVGNVWEWVADWIQGDYIRWEPSHGATNDLYGNDEMYGVNPANSQGGGQNFPSALIRGGNFSIGQESGVFALHAHFSPAFLYSDIGFRCAR